MKIYYPLSFRNIKLLVHMLVVRVQEYKSTRVMFRNISASMSANPLVQEIQASRNKIVQHRQTPPPAGLTRSHWK